MLRISSRVLRGYSGATAQRVRIHELGSSDVLTVEDFPVPSASAGHVVVQQDYAGVNFIDTYFRTGLYKADLPLTLGKEGAGTVIEVGEGVEGVKKGDRVGYCLVDGTYAGVVEVPASKALVLPESVSTRTAAALLIQGLTAHYLVTDSYRVREGDNVLVHAGAGGMGQLLCQICSMKGARVITTVSTEEKARIARTAGANDVIVYTKDDFKEKTRELVPKGVQVVYDGVGASTFTDSLGTLAVRGTMVSYGNASGPPPLFNVLDLSRGSLFLTRPVLADFVSDGIELQGRMADLYQWLAGGHLSLSVGAEYPLREAAAAQDALEGRATTGKVLLRTH